MFKHQLSASDRERLETGGPLNPLERVIVEQMLHQYFNWVTGRGLVRVEWSTVDDPLWWDTVHITGTPAKHWGGQTQYPGQEIRRWVLGYFAEEEVEPEPENGLVVDEATADWLSAL
jgi:hypothetical protein